MCISKVVVAYIYINPHELYAMSYIGLFIIQNYEDNNPHDMMFPY